VNSDIDNIAVLRLKEDQRSRGDRDESDFSCTPAYIAKLISTSRIYAENEFVGDRNARMTRNTSLGCWQYFVLSATIDVEHGDFSNVIVMVQTFIF